MICDQVFSGDRVKEKHRCNFKRHIEKANHVPVPFLKNKNLRVIGFVRVVVSRSSIQMLCVDIWRKVFFVMDLYLSQYNVFQNVSWTILHIEKWIFIDLDLVRMLHMNSLAFDEQNRKIAYF